MNLKQILVGLLLSSQLPANEATPVERLKVADGFKVERLYSVPKANLGSWVVLCKEKNGRLIAGDQYGSLYRFTPPASGQTLKDSDIEKIDLDIGHAWGLCYAFDSLYVVVNASKHGGRGLYRVQDTDGNDTYDKVTLLKKFPEAGGEHGVHAVIPGPDGKSLYIASGNQTPLPKYNTSRIAEVWGEDLLIPRIYGKGFMRHALAPQGWVAKTDPEGKHWEIVATGFRNQYDIDFNADGEMFTYDADMEWDISTPWYRPTRVNHVISAAEFGWRNGAGKWPDYYSDSFGATVDIGPGSPTGVLFGTGAKFPAKYQKAFYACDWSYGKLYAVHNTPSGSTYTSTAEEFISGQPLPLTDLVIGDDGAMYFTVGGRKVQAGVYRVTYTGNESTAPAELKDSIGQEARKLRRALEKYHLKPEAKGIDAAWPHLGSDDRALRFAARAVLEKQPLRLWKKRVFTEKNVNARLAGIIALARIAKPEDQAKAFDAVIGYDYEKLNLQQRLDLLRSYTLIFTRLGPPTDKQKSKLIGQVNRFFPAETQAEMVEIGTLLTYLKAPGIITRLVDRLEAAPTQEEQIVMALLLRRFSDGWEKDQRARYFKWFVRASNYKGGVAFRFFIDNIKKEALKNTPAREKKALAKIINAKPTTKYPVYTGEPLKFVKKWTMKDLKGHLTIGLEGERNFKQGKQLFAAVGCYACHRFGDQGGASGPDLTSAAGKFSPTDLLESIIEPSKEISDQYNTLNFHLKNGKVVNGRIANLVQDRYLVQADLYAPGILTHVKHKDLVKIEDSKVSQMPPGLLNNLTDDQILDLLAYILSEGDPTHDHFSK